MTENDVEEIVAEMKSPAKFKILDVIKDRSYPTENVQIFIDEQIAYMAASVDEDIKKLENEADKSVDDEKKLKEITKRREELIAKRDEIIKEIGGNCYTFTIVGISEGKREDLLKLAMEKYPMEYTSETNTYTGEKIKEEIDNPDRNQLFTELLWQAHIQKIIAPDGAEQDGLTIEEVVELRRALPIVATARINEAIEKIRTATAMFMFSADEDFLARS